MGLIGRVVDVLQADGSVATGTVSSLSLATENPVITLRTVWGDALPGVALSQIVNVR